jgi:hypothetical protein
MTLGRQNGNLEWFADRPGSKLLRIGIEDEFGLRGSDITVALEVGDADRAFTASPLATTGTGGGGSFGWVGFGLLGLALAWPRPGQR